MTRSSETTSISNRTIGHLSKQNCLSRLCHHALQISVNGASTILCRASWNITGLRDYFDPELNYWPAFWAKILSTISSLCPKNERQCSVNDFMPCILQDQRAVALSWSRIEVSTAFLGNNACDKIVTMSQNARQWSVNNLWSCILDNLTAMGRRKPTMNRSAAPMRENASDDIDSTSYNWAPAEHSQFLGRLRMLHSNELHCAVPKSSFTGSVFAI